MVLFCHARQEPGQITGFIFNLHVALHNNKEMEVYQPERKEKEKEKEEKEAQEEASPPKPVPPDSMFLFKASNP